MDNEISQVEIQASKERMDRKLPALDERLDKFVESAEKFLDGFHQLKQHLLPSLPPQYRSPPSSSLLPLLPPTPQTIIIYGVYWVEAFTSPVLFTVNPLPEMVEEAPPEVLLKDGSIEKQENEKFFQDPFPVKVEKEDNQRSQVFFESVGSAEGPIAACCLPIIKVEAAAPVQASDSQINNPEWLPFWGWLSLQELVKKPEQLPIHVGETLNFNLPLNTALGSGKIPMEILQEDNIVNLVCVVFDNEVNSVT